jgi:hypothetical protein
VGTESHVSLVAALQRFLEDAARAIDLERGRRGLERVSTQALAQSLAGLPAAIEANELARKASLASGYLPRGPAGRPLDADALVSTGLVGMLLDRGSADFQDVASDLAGYLAGPPIDIWDYAILNGCGTLQDAIQVVDGWELAIPGADELRMLLPLLTCAGLRGRLGHGSSLSGVTPRARKRSEVAWTAWRLFSTVTEIFSQPSAARIRMTLCTSK